MNEAIRDEWVTALRSGDYRQGTGSLRELEVEDGGDPKFCCLGVLCDIAVKHGVTHLVNLDDYGNTFYGVPETDEKSSAFLPESVMTWAGIGSPSADFHDQGTSPVRGGPEDDERLYHSLVDLNDSGYSFDSIANVIAEKF